MRRVSYYIKDLETVDDAATIHISFIRSNIVNEFDLEWYAELAAEHAWDHNGELDDGFIVVIIINGQEYGSFGIHVDWSPIFHISKISD